MKHISTATTRWYCVTKPQTDTPTLVKQYYEFDSVVLTPLLHQLRYHAKNILIMYLLKTIWLRFVIVLLSVEEL